MSTNLHPGELVYSGAVSNSNGIVIQNLTRLLILPIPDDHDLSTADEGTGILWISARPRTNRGVGATVGAEHLNNTIDENDLTLSAPRRVVEAITFLQ